MGNNAIMPLLRNIIPCNLKAYLNGKGWITLDFPRTDVWLLEDGTTKEQVLIPKEKDYDLYTEDIFRVVEKIRHTEGRNIDLVVAQLLCPDADIVRFRIQSQQIGTGTLPLNAVKNFVGSVINAFKAALLDSIKPNLHHSRIGGARLEQLLEHIRFGQTEHGSYVVKIITPALQGEQSPLFAQENDTRKGIIHLLTSTNEIIQVIDGGNASQAEQFIINKKSNPTISDNFVNALSDMQLSEDTSVEITADWSPLISQPPISKVEIKPEHFRSIAAIGCRLSPHPEDHPVEFFTGFVTQLDGNANELGKPEGDVRVEILTHSQGELSAFVVLKQEQYQTAIDAHKDTIPVFFTGKLVRKSARRHEIIDVYNFKLSTSETPYAEA